MLFFVVVVVLGLFLFFCLHNLTDPPKNDSDRPGMAGVEFTAATWCVRDYFIFLGGRACVCLRGISPVSIVSSAKDFTE